MLTVTPGAVGKRSALIPTSRLSTTDVAEIRRRIGDHPVFRLYFETALEALDRGEDNRRFRVSAAGGLIQAIDFDTLTVMTAIGALTEMELALIIAEPPPIELHLERNTAETVRRIAPGRITADLELRYYTLAPEHPVKPDPRCERLHAENLPEIRAFAHGYNPKTVFSDWMIELPLYGLREAGELMAIGGVIDRHAGLGVCMLGNFVTATKARGRGYAKALCRTLVAGLRTEGYRTTTLCTTTDNVAARRAYEAVGFRCLEMRVQLELSGG